MFLKSELKRETFHVTKQNKLNIYKNERGGTKFSEILRIRQGI